jgi:hypothetical protein
MQHLIAVLIVGVLFWLCARLAWRVLKGLGLSGVALLGFLWLAWYWGSGGREIAAPSGSAAAYRDAQDAVARASGHPCDYACKVMIADQGRRRAPPSDNSVDKL